MSNIFTKEIMKRLPEAVAWLKSQHSIQFAYLFGSMASGRPGPMSDVDIAVHLDQTAVNPDAKLEILGKLMDIFETDRIDLVVLNQASLPLKMNVIRGRRVIVDNLPFERHRFESKTMREYFDFSFLEKNILMRRYGFGRHDPDTQKVI